jgi:hypothetical protein
MDTRDDLDRDEAEDLYGRLSAAAARTARRRRARRVAGVGVSAAALIGAMVWAGAGLSGLRSGPTKEASSKAPNYRFTDVSVSKVRGPVRQQERPFVGWLVVTATPEWTSGDYPGWHDCRWTLKDQGGTELGLNQASFASTTPGTAVRFAAGQITDSQMIPEGMRINIECDEERLDSPQRLADLSLDGPLDYTFDDVAASMLEGEAGLPGVAISYRASWSTDAYPGAHQCAWIARDASGAIVALQHGELDSMMQNVKSHPVPIPMFGAPPLSGEVLCSPTRTDTPAAYVISGERIVHDEQGRLAVEYDMVWPEDVHLPAYPATNACAQGVHTPDGANTVGKGYTLSAGPGTYQVGLPPVGSHGSTEGLRAIVRCIPWTGQGSIEQARELVTSELGQL